MLRNTRIKIMYNGELINTYSDLGNNAWKNPFEYIPCVGDTLCIFHEYNESENRYKVIEREVTSMVGFTSMNIKSEVILHVEKIEKGYCIKL